MKTILIVLGLVVLAAMVGFVAGAMVYRNNAKKAEEATAVYKTAYEGLVKKIERKAAEIKEKI